MTGRTPPRQRLRFAAALAATLVAGTAIGSSGQAQVAQDAAAAIVIPAATSGPHFQPSPQAAFEQAFADLGAPLPATSAAPHAVDVTEITATQPAAATHLGTGSASYYADRFHGQRTASGERFDNTAYTAAHRTLPFGTRVRVTNPATGASVVVRINDRGPFIRGRTIDVSRAAAERLGLIRAGHAPVSLDLLDS